MLAPQARKQTKPTKRKVNTLNNSYSSMFQRALRKGPSIQQSHKCFCNDINYLPQEVPSPVCP